ncbi:MAG: hypothetical protein ACOZJZ_00030 [Pseudomonadota bacterium]
MRRRNLLPAHPAAIHVPLICRRPCLPALNRQFLETLNGRVQQLGGSVDAIRRQVLAEVEALQRETPP